MIRIHSAILNTIFSYIIMFVLISPFLKNSKKHSTAIEHRTGIILFSLFIITVFNIAGIPNFENIAYSPNINFQPFKHFSRNFIEYFLNVILFIPLGFFLPSLWKGFQKFKYVFISGFMISAFIELFQLFAVRVTDINDIFTNTLGAIIGYYFYKSTKKVIPNTTEAMCLSDTKNTLFLKTEPFLYFTVCWASMFFIKPVIETYISFR